MICPNCKKQIPSNSRFCTYCGFKFNKSYIEWFIKSFKRPTENDNNNNSYGLVSLLISFLMMIVFIFISFVVNNESRYLQKMVAEQTSYKNLSNFLSNASDYDKDVVLNYVRNIIKIKLTIYSTMSLLTLLTAVIFFYLACKHLINKDISFSSAMTYYFNYTNWIIIFELIIICLTILKVNLNVTGILYASVFFLFSVSLVYLLPSLDDNGSGRGKLAGMIILICILSIIIFAYFDTSLLESMVDHQGDILQKSLHLKKFEY